MSAHRKFTTNFSTVSTMAKQKHLSQSQSQIAALLQCAPPWFARDGCTFTKSAGRIHLNFAKACSCGRRQQTVNVGNSRSLERAEKVGAALAKSHNEHQPATVTASAPKTGEEVLQQQATDIERLEKALQVQRVASAEFEHQAGVNKRKAEAFDAAGTKTAHAKRVKTAKEKKRQDINPTNRTAFGEGVRSAKMRGERGTGIEEMLEVHCEGSEAKLLDIVYAIIGKYNLQAQVKGHFGITVDATNAYIVGRAKAALKELKHCRSEAQRQQYRLVLTVLAPESGVRKAEPVAAALGVDRKGKPFLDAIQMRREVDRLMKANEKQLQVGDEVLCRHGRGTLAEIDSDYDNEDGSFGKPCAVEIAISGHRQVSKFARTGKGKGGARLQRVPISFAHGSRSLRKDATSAEVKKQVMLLVIHFLAAGT